MKHFYDALERWLKLKLHIDQNEKLIDWDLRKENESSTNLDYNEFIEYYINNYSNSNLTNNKQNNN